MCVKQLNFFKLSYGQNTYFQEKNCSLNVGDEMEMKLGNFMQWIKAYKTASIDV